MYSVSSLAEHWGVSTNVVLRLIKSGQLKAFRPGKSYRISDDAVQAFEQGAPEPEHVSLLRRPTPAKIY